MKSACAHALFESQAAKHPERTALIFGGETLTYGQLNLRANALAHTLVGAGCRPDALIGLNVGRGFDLIIGILGILKAGGAYIPLDPGYPEARLRFLIEDAGISLIVSDRRLGCRSSGFRRKAIEIDSGILEPAGPVCGVDGGNSAYAIYTSGSTGTPKGVVLNHLGLRKLMEFTGEQMDIGPGDRILQFAAFTFDASVLEIFAALSHGATLVLARREDLVPGLPLRELILTQRITMFVLSPSVLQVLPPEGLDTVRIAITGGEKCTQEVVRRWAGARGFFNVYGPSEATIYATISEVDPEAGGDPSIGSPVPGTSCLVLDRTDRKASVGEAGELLIGGIGVGRGYINRPELTAEKFVTLSMDGSEDRYFRTGDRVRVRADGAFDYLGRIDRQIKVRGYRVEPDEIENCLDSHPAIASSVVVPRSDPAGGKSLMALYLPAAGRPAPTAAELSTHLSRTLPDYMVPSHFVRRNEWPLTPHGKLDREALLAGILGSNASPDVAASKEDRLRALCRKTIGASPAGLEDSLIEIGLHSLSAANLAWSIQEEFHTSLRLSDVLESPTLGNLLARIERDAGSAVATNRPRIGDLTTRPDFLPVSFPQEQIWFLEKLHPHLNSYRFQALFHCRGELDVEVLEAALNRIVGRHEILRTAFVEGEGDTPRQEIRPHVPFGLILEDLRAVPEEARRRQLDLLIHEELRRPFDSAAGPLIRWRLFQLDDNEFKLLHTEHHFLHDGWGYGSFLSELYSTYKTLSEKEDLPSQSPPTQFADFALWQREAMASGSWDNQLAYWTKELAGCPPPPSLPSDRRMSIPRTFEGLQIRRPFPEAVWEELGRVCSRDGVTRFAWLHAAFQLFIHRYTGAEDFCVGSGFANRRDLRLQGMLGMVINTLPIRARFDGVTTFRELAQRASHALRRASDNQELPFERVVQEMNPHRDANANPFFNTCIGSYEDVFPHFRSDRLEITSDDAIACGQVKFDLMALLIPPKCESANSSVRSPAPLILWEFSTELFESSTGELMLDHFLCLIESSVREPEGHVGSLSIMAREERNRVLEFGHGPAAPPECERPVHRVFESIAAAAPDDCAVAAGETVMSYRELNIRSNRLASRLVARGCSPGSIIVVALPHGFDAIICLLAVLKAGCAYLPIDLRDPAGRIARLVGLVDARLVLTHTDSFSNLPRLPDGTEVLLVDEQLAAEEHNLLTDVSPDSAAYVLFTSGSSGIPKAVVVPHRAISRLVFGLPEIVLNSSEVVLHFAPLNFDASTFEIWGALLHGAKLVIHGDEFADISALGETLGRHRVTTAWLTSSLFNQIIDSSPSVLSGLRQLITGGEALSPGHIGRAQELLPGTRLFNGYGPTETTTFATVYSIPKPFANAAASVPIGRPIAGTQALVFSSGVDGIDGRCELAPLGVPGELYIGGDGVALGYFELAELTAERFVCDPQGLFSGRFYRTGDFVRWRSDGNLEFMGRADAQVKIRGYRIEPGEIEAVLKCHPDVEDAAVVAREDKAGERELVGYVVSRKDNIFTEWRAYLLEKLPSYMIPSAIVKLPTLPLTASGKIDRAALPKPERHAVSPDAHAALTPSEEMVASVWSDVLGLKDFGPHENFFELGGHSLLATRVVSQLRACFGVEVPLRAVFDNPTVSAIGEFIESAYRAAQSIPSELPNGTLREEALF